MSAFYYHVIEKEPVFLSFEKSKLLSEETIADKSTMWKFQVHANDGKERQESKSIEIDYLKKLYKSNPEEFREKWIYFNISGNSAKDNLYRLLNSYVLFYKKEKTIFFRDLRQTSYNEIESRERDYEYDERWPLGKKFRLLCKKGVFKKFYFELEIDISKINCISGSLKEFTIQSENFEIKFSQNSILQKLS